MSLTRVSTSGDVHELAAALLDPNRKNPWCVVSTPADTAEPLFDVDQLHDDIGDVCRVTVIETGTLSWQLDELLPDRCQVFGGAARVYPVGLEWATAPEQSPLRFMRHPADADRLVTDALGMAHEAGLFEQAPPQATPASGIVASLLAGGSRVMVTLDSGDVATVQHEMTFPEIPLDWVLSVGQRISGLFDPVTRRLQLDVVRLDERGLLEHFPSGSVTLALVLEVDRQQGRLAVHPSLPITVARRDVSSNPLDRVDLLLAPGDVVAVRVVRDERGRTRLRLNDIDDDELPLPALPLMDGGEPWLQEGRHRRDPEPVVVLPAVELPATAAPAPAPAPIPTPLPGPGFRPAVASAAATSTAAPATAPTARVALQSTQLQLELARDEVRALTAQLARSPASTSVLNMELRESIAEGNALRARIAVLQAEQSTQRELLRKSRQKRPVSFAERRDRFDDADDWVRHELYLAWVDRLDAADRRRSPLPTSINLGERFADSLASLDAAILTKAFKAGVDVLTGRAKDLPARAVHALRSGNGGGAADVVRGSDGARCMRAYVEQNTASARRLHYWVLPDSSVELSRVVLHDDVEP